MQGQTTAGKQDAHEEKMADSGGYSSIPGHTTKFRNPLTNRLPPGVLNGAQRFRFASRIQDQEDQVTNAITVG
jgi:hypothetical protein